jgi:ankyrin repeat protein
MLLVLSPTAIGGVRARDWQLEEASVLKRAAREGNIAQVQEILRQGQDVNENYGSGEATPLIFAASAGRVEVVRLLLKRGANPNLCSWANVCPIWWATQSGSYETVKALIEAGADVRKNPGVNALEKPTLHEAVFTGKSEIVQLLLDNGIEIDHTNFFAENTALAFAVRVGQAKIAKMLIERGADLGAVTEVPYYGEETALEIANKEGHHAAVEVVEAARKSGKYKPPKYSVESLIEKLYGDSSFDLSTQDKDLVQFLRRQTKETLRRVRNTIYARKNFQFDNPQLTEYFRKRFPTYKPVVRKYEMSEVDKRNVRYIQEIEQYRAARDAAG